MMVWLFHIVQAGQQYILGTFRDVYTSSEIFNSILEANVMSEELV